MEPFFLTIAAIVATLGAVRLGQWIKASRLVGQQKEYRDLGEPVLITQDGPHDRTFWERAETERRRIEETGNRWQPPVVAVPWDSPFTVTIAGETKTFSTVGMGRREYARYALAVYDAVYSHWQGKVLEVGGMSALMQFTKNQKEPAPPVW